MEVQNTVDLSRIPENKLPTKQTLNDILMDLERADAGELTTDEAKLVFRRLTNKVDAIYERIRDQEFVQLRLKEDSKRDAGAAKVAENRIKSFKNYIKMAMEQTGQDSIEGDKFKYGLSNPKPKEVVNLVYGEGVENNQKLMNDFIDSPMVDVKLSWNEAVILKTLADTKDPAELESYSELFTSETTTVNPTRALRAGVITK